MRDLVSLEARKIASIFPGGSTSARSLRSRSESRETRRRGNHKNSPRRNRPRRLPIRDRLLEQRRDQDERRLSAILGYWSDRSVSVWTSSRGRDTTPTSSKARRIASVATFRCRRFQFEIVDGVFAH